MFKMNIMDMMILINIEERVIFIMIIMILKIILSQRGDYINIRSDTTLEKKDLIPKFSYLVTFLIELDPL